jgi:HlyD family secretion protein
VLQVPASAVYESDGRTAVLIVARGRLEERRVTIGHRTPLAAEVTAGLVEGERVVAHPRRELEAGMRVTPMPAR